MQPGSKLRGKVRQLNQANPRLEAFAKLIADRWKSLAVFAVNAEPAPWLEILPDLKEGYSKIKALPCFLNAFGKSNRDSSVQNSSKSLIAAGHTEPFAVEPVHWSYDMQDLLERLRIGAANCERQNQKKELLDWVGTFKKQLSALSQRGLPIILAASQRAFGKSERPSYVAQALEASDEILSDSQLVSLFGPQLLPDYLATLKTQYTALPDFKCAKNMARPARRGLLGELFENRNTHRQ